MDKENNNNNNDDANRGEQLKTRRALAQLQAPSDEAEKRAHDAYIAKLIGSLTTSANGPASKTTTGELTTTSAAAAVAAPSEVATGSAQNECLLDGFVLLRLAQLINFDVHYIGKVVDSKPLRNQQQVKQRLFSESRQVLTPSVDDDRTSWETLEAGGYVTTTATTETTVQEHQSTLIDELVKLNPLNGLIERWRWLASACRLVRVMLSLCAILLSLNKVIATAVLCILSRKDLKSRSLTAGNVATGSSPLAPPPVIYEASDVTMSWFVWVLINLTASYTLIATVFDGHLLWQLLSQRLFLVGRRFQYKTMLSLLVFLYLEYIINLSFINNLFTWPFESTSSGALLREVNNNTTQLESYDLHNSYSALTYLQVFVTEKHKHNHYVDILLTIFQFARGIIRVSPYVIINYVLLCLIEHVKTIREQHLLTDSLKKRHKLRMVMRSSRAKSSFRSLGDHQNKSAIAMPTSSSSASAAAAAAAATTQLSQQRTASKKRVIFVTEASGSSADQQVGGASSPNHLAINTSISRAPSPGSSAALSPVWSRASSSPSYTCELINGTPTSTPTSAPTPTQETGRGSWSAIASNTMAAAAQLTSGTGSGSREKQRVKYLAHIDNFDELESYITNLYIFTGRLNRLMSKQGLALFFIVHNLTITCTLIVPEAISGGPAMASFIRLLVVLIAIVPFISGQSLNAQLEQLSRQIDRIIIQQQFIGRKRDNLVRIRELLHDIRVNCGGMLNFNVETGIKYLVVAFASAFFIEQEDAQSNQSRNCNYATIMMDWWSSTTSSGAAATNFGPTTELQLDTSTTLLAPGTPAPPTSSSAASPPPPPPPTHSNFFDPWLNCDDLDLGAILQHHHHHHQVNNNNNNHAFNEQLAVSSSMEFSQTPAYQQQQQQQQTVNCTGNQAARLAASDNKQQILSIINNSRHNGELNSGQQQGHRSSGLDPSSLGSSPINSLNSNYSLSPHSPVQFANAQTTVANQQQHHQHHHNRSLVLFSPIGDSNNNYNNTEAKPSVINQHSDLNNNNNNNNQQSSYCFAQSDGYISSEQKKEQSRYSQQQQLQIAPTGRSSLGQRQYHKNNTSSSSASSQAVGNSLLTVGNCSTNKPSSGEQPRKQQTIRKSSQQSTSGAGGSVNKNGNVKLRRCRHITDYVLAEEEKRLLIKEGHSDFPMTCQARPLTKSEERILRKIRRKIRNKRSAQCSRQRKKEYVEDLERRYAEINRENEQLKQMIARMQQQQDCNNQQAQNQYQIEDLQQQQQQQQQQQTNLQAPTTNTFSDDDVCLEGQSSNESVDMNWKDIFQPQSSVSTTTARLAVAAAAAAAAAATSNQQQQTANVIFS